MRKEIGLGEGELQQDRGEVKDTDNCWYNCRNIQDKQQTRTELL
jgi:hypothetical protein